ncbi:MAG: GIY-YIG nuclease family protein [Verrucomicrobiota bacterium]
MKNITIIIDPNIWKQSRLTRDEFSRRIRQVKAIRMEEPYWNFQDATLFPVFSCLPRNLESWGLLSRLHNLVNKGVFSVFGERIDYKVFALLLPIKLTEWLLNTEIDTVKLQILNWIAASMCLSGCAPDEKQDAFPLEIQEAINSIRNKYYDKRFTHEKIFGRNNLGCPQRAKELQNRYWKVGRDLTGGIPEFMRHLFQSYEKLNWETWGINATSFTVEYRIACFRDEDWIRVIQQEEEDSLVHCENNSEVWQKWLHTFEAYPMTNKHIFSLFGESRISGFVYLFLGQESGHYKIGFTADSNPYARLGQLQMGSSENFLPAGHFRAASKKTEAVVHNCFSGKWIRGEWFALTHEDRTNILDDDWRMRNNIF